MRFGWLTLSLSPSPEEDAARIDQQIEQVRAAEQLGFGDVWLTEHYFTGESVYNDALLFASAVAMRTQRIRIGFAVVQLPFHHPVRLAVQLALLDNLSKGRIDVGVGKGTIYNEYEFVGHGLRSDDSRERMEEAVDIIGRLWRVHRSPKLLDPVDRRVHIVDSDISNPVRRGAPVFCPSSGMFVNPATGRSATVNRL
jgi:alkanesulfonate monooxygenase SsuD/methylene tetrahydromethanopterin reductase-like flavin-dependent oxidoreductase (luciferase family)